MFGFGGGHYEEDGGKKNLKDWIIIYGLNFEEAAHFISSQEKNLFHGFSYNYIHLLVYK